MSEIPSSDLYLNFWNTSTGGNYWANPSGTGFSQTCTDRGDGICDQQHDLGAGNIDYQPLAELPSWDIFPISSCTDLQNMQPNLLAEYYLTQNIDCQGFGGAEGFVPVGDNTNPFTGILDGQGYNITGLYINRPSANYIGLFGYNTGEIKNLGLIDVNIIGHQYVGGLVGNNYQGIISNVHLIGSVSSSGKYGAYAGGLVGQNWGTISDSSMAGDVNGVLIHTGGLVGENYGGTISNSYSTGNVRSTGDYTGGLVGISNGPITNCYSTGNVSGIYVVGGLVGQNAGAGTGVISNSYATGSVSGSDWVGALVGYNQGTISKSYWNNETANQANCVGYIETGSIDCYGKTTAQMKQQATFAGWDFTNVWGISEGTTYPWLKQQVIFSPPVIQDADGDGVKDSSDNCVNEKNPDQADMDADGLGDVCDNCAACAGACCVEEFSTGENLAPSQALAINTGDAVLEMPENSVSNNISISLTKGSGSNFMICMPESGECGTVVSIYTIGKVGQSFNNDYTLKLSYGDREECSWGACEIWYSDDNGITWSNPWGPPAIEGGYLVITANHFSEYAIVTAIEGYAALTNRIAAKPGDNVDVRFTEKIQEDAWAWQFIFNYPSVLQYSNYEFTARGNAITINANPMTYEISSQNNEIKFIGSGIITAGNDSLISFNFNVPSDAPEGIYDLTLSDVITADTNDNAMSLELINSQIIIDGTPPTVTLQNVPTSSSWRNSAVYVNIKCEDELSGCAQIKYGLSDNQQSCAANQIYQGSITVPDESYLCYEAKDAAGNSASGTELIDYFNFNAPVTVAAISGEPCEY